MTLINAGGNMVFFSTDNPVLLLLAVILLAALLKGLLSRIGFFAKKGRGAWITPIIIVLVLLFIMYKPLIQIFGSSAAMMTVLLVFLIFLWMAFGAIGTSPDRVFRSLREIGFLKMTVIITVCCIFALSISQVYGERLLEEPTVSFSDAFVQETGQTELDLSPLFTAKALGFGLVVLVLIMFFFYVITH